MDLNRYNTRIRHAISDEYVKCNKKRDDISKLMSFLEQNLVDFMNGITVLTYKEYMDIKNEIETLRREHDKLTVASDIWRNAREICLDIADEMDGD